MKKLFALCLVSGSLMLSGCGFTPVYGAKGEGALPVQESLNNIYINTIPNHHGVILRNNLIDRLYFHGRPASPQARLTINLSSVETNRGIKKDATTTRSQLTMTAHYSLKSMDEQTTLLQGIASTTVSYSKLDAQYGTLATQRDAYKRALNEVSEQIVNRLSLFYAEKAPPKTQ